MKSCISTYSFERLYQDGGFTRFNAIDKTKEYGCQGGIEVRTAMRTCPVRYRTMPYVTRHS